MRDGLEIVNGVPAYKMPATALPVGGAYMPAFDVGTDSAEPVSLFAIASSYDEGLIEADDLAILVGSTS